MRVSLKCGMLGRIPNVLTSDLQGPAIHPVKHFPLYWLSVAPQPLSPLRESENSSFDWFKSYGDMADIMRELIPDKSSRILMLGCGNSTLSQDVRPRRADHLLMYDR